MERRIMDFAAFDTKKMEAYKEQARKEWGQHKRLIRNMRKKPGKDLWGGTCAQAQR